MSQSLAPQDSSGLQQPRQMLELTSEDCLWRASQPGMGANASWRTIEKPQLLYLWRAFRPLFLVLRLTLATELICWTYVMWLILNFTTVSCSSAGLCQTRMEMSSQPSNSLSRARDRRCAWSCLVSNSYFGAFPDQTDELPELPQIPQRITWTSAINHEASPKRLASGCWWNNVMARGRVLERCWCGASRATCQSHERKGNARSVLSPIETLNFVVHCIAGPYIAPPRLPYQHEDGHVEEGHGSYWWPDRISRSYKRRHGLRCVCPDGHIVDVQSLTTGFLRVLLMLLRTAMLKTKSFSRWKDVHNRKASLNSPPTWCWRQRGGW